MKKKFENHYTDRIFFYQKTIHGKILCDKLGIKFNLLPQKVSFLFFIKEIFTANFYKIFFRGGYFSLICYLQLKKIKPKYLITFTDNDLRFYLLKKFFDNIIFISIQNGAREKLFDFFGHPKLSKYSKKKYLSCDYIFTFSEDYEKEYKKYIKSKYIVSGSFLNNFSMINKLKKKQKDILIISNYRDLKHLEKTRIVKKNYYYHFKKKTNITINDYRNLFFFIRDILNLIPNINDFKIKVLGASLHFSNYEKLFFDKVFENLKYTFIKKNINRDPYYFTDIAYCVISTGSTLGFESLSRGNLTLLVDRNPIYKKVPKLFTNNLWPNKSKSNEIILPIKDVKKSKQKMLNFLNPSKLKNFNKIIAKKYFSKLIYYNPNNTLLINKINKIIKK